MQSAFRFYFCLFRSLKTSKAQNESGRFSYACAYCLATKSELNCVHLQCFELNQSVPAENSVVTSFFSRIESRICFYPQYTHTPHIHATQRHPLTQSALVFEPLAIRSMRLSVAFRLVSYLL